MSLTDARIPSVIHELEKRCEPPFSEANFASRAIECIEDCEREIKALRAKLEAIEALVYPGLYSPEWIAEHKEDDHMCTLDHKDEIEYAELIEALLRILRPEAESPGPQRIDDKPA